MGWVILVVLALIWGSSFILIKKGLEVFEPLQVGSIRIAAAGLSLLPVALYNLRKLNRQNWMYLLSIGLLGSFIPAFLFATAQTQINSSIAGVLNALTPLFTIIVGAVLFSVRTTRKITYGILLGFAGTTLLVITGESELLSFNAYALLVVLATTCYGLNINLIKYKLEGMRALHITSISLLMVTPVALVYLLEISDFMVVMETDPGANFALLYLSILGVMGTAVALIMFNKLVKITNPVFTSTVTYLIPIVALIWGFLDGEVLLAGHYTGMVIILAGVYLSSRKG